MIQVPSMVAFQHGAGGVAAFLVSLVELSRTTHALSLVSEISGVLGLAIGSLTFSGSMIASAKLANKMHQAPQVLTHHNLFVILNFVASDIIGALSLLVSGERRSPSFLSWRLFWESVLVSFWRFVLVVPICRC